MKLPTKLDIGSSSSACQLLYGAAKWSVLGSDGSSQIRRRLLRLLNLLTDGCVFGSKGRQRFPCTVDDVVKELINLGSVRTRIPDNVLHNGRCGHAQLQGTMHLLRCLLYIAFTKRLPFCRCRLSAFHITFCLFKFDRHNQLLSFVFTDWLW